MNFSKVLADATQATTLTWNRYARRDAGAYPIPPSGRTALVAGLVAYAGASFLHFAHNAQYLADYPNLSGFDLNLSNLLRFLVGAVLVYLYARGVQAAFAYHRLRAEAPLSRTPGRQASA